jgi:peptide/nickel transport system permease protein
MAFYIGQRLIYVMAIAVIMSLLVFAATHILPGDAAVMILGQYATPESLAVLRENLGLNLPLHVQYWNWASEFVQGDMGRSLAMDRPVAPIVWAALANSMQLAIISITCVSVIGITAGVLAGVYRGSIYDHASSLVAYLGISVPEFFWGILLVIVFAQYLGWLPSAGYAPLREGIGPYAAHMIMPVVTLTLTLMAHILRMTRASILEVLQSQYVKAARAKGLPEWIVILRHALPNSLLPTITVIAFDFGFLIGDVVVVESIFGYPGVGRLLIYSIHYLDHNARLHVRESDR